MNNIQKTRELQQQTTQDVRTIQTHIKGLMARVNGSGLSHTSKTAYIKLLNDQVSRLTTVETQLNHPPVNRYEAFQMAQAQRDEISKIISNISKIKESLSSKLGATAQNTPTLQQRQPSPEKSRAPAPQHNYVLPEVPTTPTRSQIAHSTPLPNPLLDKFSEVNQKLSQTKFQLISLKQCMLAEKNTDKKIALHSEIVSAQKIQTTIQDQLNTIYPQLADPKKSATLSRQLTDISGALTRLDDRMTKAYTKNMPVAPSSRPQIPPASTQRNRTSDDDDRPRGPRR